MNSKAFEEFKWRRQEPESKRQEAPGQGTLGTTSFSKSNQ